MWQPHHLGCLNLAWNGLLTAMSLMSVDDYANRRLSKNNAMQAGRGVNVIKLHRYVQMYSPIGKPPCL